MHYLAPPPARTHFLHSTSQSSAQEFIARYLDSARVQAALHPDAQLTEQGPVAAQGGGRFGLTLHNLGRIEAGLRGERIQPEILPPTADALEVIGDITPAGQQAEGGGSGGEDGWMDKEVFERRQDEDEVLLRDGPNEREEEEITVQEVGDGANLNQTSPQKQKRKRNGGEEQKVDPEARKKAKKERRKLEKAEAEAERRKKAAKD